MTATAAPLLSAPANAPRPALRITRRGRLVLAALVAAPGAALVAIAALQGAPAVATDEASGATFSYVTVEAGESLWSVAERVAPDSDPRDVIADIERLNGLQTSAVSAGESLAVPAEYAR